MMEEFRHFWYSKKQAALRYDFLDWGRCFALIDKKRVEYTEASSKDKPGGKWDDYVYLGKGLIMDYEPHEFEYHFFDEMDEY